MLTPEGVTTLRCCVVAEKVSGSELVSARDRTERRIVEQVALMGTFWPLEEIEMPDVTELTAESVDAVPLPGPSRTLFLRRSDGTTWAAFCARARRLRDRCEVAGARWTVEGDYVAIIADSLPFGEGMQRTRADMRS